MKCNASRLTGYQLLTELVVLGFRNLSALAHICTTIDNSISNLDIQTLWLNGECNTALQLKLENVLEILKNE